MLSVSISILSIQSDLFKDLFDPWTLNCLFILLGQSVFNVEGFYSNLAVRGLNVLPGLLLFTFMFICIFLD